VCMLFAANWISVSYPVLSVWFISWLFLEPSLKARMSFFHVVQLCLLEQVRSLVGLVAISVFKACVYSYV